jgi:predicted DNA-binding protein
MGDHMEKQITMKLPEEMYSDLRKLSIQKDNAPLANLIRRAIDDYLRKNRLKGNL